MEIFTATKSFNKELVGKAIRLQGTNRHGRAFNSVFLVNEVGYDYIILLSHIGAYYEFITDDFEHENNPLKISVLEK